MNPTREIAWKLLTQYTKGQGLIKHALAVEAAMRAYAYNFKEDQQQWGICGLLHDFDYEQNPDPKDHPRVGAKILRELGYPKDMIYAIKAHADHMKLERRSRMDKALFAVDELCGFLTAVTLVRPGKNIAEVPVKSVRKKLKDKAFARSVSRDDIYSGASELCVDLDEHIAFVRDAMIRVAEELRLSGH